MADLENFDANQVDPAQDFEAIPPGKYEAMIAESEWVENSGGNGSHLKLTLIVIGGIYEGRLLWHRLNLKNQSEKAVQIAKGQLSAICRAVKVLTPKDSTQLHNLPLIVRVDVREYEGQKYNDVKAFYPVEGATKAPVTGQMKTPAPTPAKAGAAPWKK